MKRLVFMLCAFGAVCSLASGPTHSISARAGFSIRHTDDPDIDAASIVMNIVGSKGDFQFAAEDHGGALLCCIAPTAYPEIIARTTKILSVTYRGNSFSMVADGNLQGEPARIEVSAFDGGPSRPDKFEIRILREGGLVYQRSSQIETGDIVIK